MNKRTKVFSLVIILIFIFSPNSSLYAQSFYSKGFSKNLIVKTSAPSYIILTDHNKSNYDGKYMQNKIKDNKTSENSLKTSTLNTTINTDISFLTDEEKKLAELINNERIQRKLSPLEIDQRLSNLAETKALDMKENNYFSHNSPTYGSPFDMMKKVGISYSLAGENIATNSNIIKAHYSLMNSDGHRANILNPYYNKLGIGIVTNKEGNGIIIVEMFIKE